MCNEYELDETGLNIHRFQRDAEWFRYIFQNRKTVDALSADVVMGPIANDTLFDTLGILTSGFLRPEEALRLLLIGPEYTQAAVKTEKALKQLRWLGAEKIAGLDADARLIEQDAYQTALAKAMGDLI